MINLDQALQLASATKEKIGDRLLVGLYRFGGAGDTLILGGLAKHVKKQWPGCYIQAHIRNNKEILESFPEIDSIVEWNYGPDWKDAVRILNKEYDVFIDCQYATKIFFKPKLRTSSFAKRHFSKFKKYKWFYDNWVQSNTKLHELNEHILDIINGSTGFNIVPSDLQIPETFDPLTLKIINSGRYVTVHNWADRGIQTKMWSFDSMATVAEILKSEGFNVYQVGGSGEQPIKNAEYLSGKLSWKQTSTILKHSSLHIDIEGGLVYIATSHKTPCIVLFGPTPVECFGWKGNVNIRKSDCAPCWWSSDKWFTTCPEKYGAYNEPPKCMFQIGPGDVIDEAAKILKFKKKPVLKNENSNYEQNYENDADELILDEDHYKNEPWQMERLKTMVKDAKGKCLEVGAGDGFMMKMIVDKGNPVEGVEISQKRIDRIRSKYGYDVKKADIRRLPFGDAKFDTVYAGEILEHLPNISEGMSELERVCRKDGQIIVSIPINEEHDNYYLHKWAIRHEIIKRNGKDDMLVLKLKRINR